MRNLFILLTAVVGLLMSCQTDTTSPPVHAFDPEPWLDKGNRVQGASFAVLSTKLKTSLATEGVAGAVSYCNMAAYPLTDTLSQMYDCSIRRATRRPRNPLNQANEYEFAILDNWEKDLKNGVPLVAVVQELSPDTVMYYSPIRIQPLCLNCHGQVGKEVTPEIATQLLGLYPDDQATGYSPGDLRGMWSIRFINQN